MTSSRSIVTAAGAVLAAVLAIVVGVAIIDWLTGGPGASPSPSGIQTVEPSSSLPATAQPTPSAPPSPTPKPSKKPKPTPTATPEPTPLAVITILGGPLDGEHGVLEQRSFVDAGNLFIRQTFRAAGDMCTLEIVLDSRYESGTYDFVTQSKGTLTCASGSPGYLLSSGSITIQRAETFSGEYTLLARSGSEEIALEGSFSDLVIETSP